jgi:hypothetical protein
VARRVRAADPPKQNADADNFQREINEYSLRTGSKRVGSNTSYSHEEQQTMEGLDPATGPPASSPAASGPVPSPSPGGTGAPFAPFGQSAHQAITSSGGGTVAGGMLGALAFFTFRAYLSGGMTGVKAFYAAKFLNKTSSQPNQVPTTTPAGAANTASTTVA